MKLSAGYQPGAAAQWKPLELQTGQPARSERVGDGEVIENGRCAGLQWPSTYSEL